MSDDQPKQNPKKGAQEPPNRPRQPTLWRTFKSVGAAFLGVQSHKNWQEDMETSTSPLRFIVVGLILGLGFIGVLFLITWLVTSLIL